MYYYQNKILIAAVIRLKFENIEIKIKNNINAYWKECKNIKFIFVLNFIRIFQIVNNMKITFLYHLVFVVDMPLSLQK